MLRGALVCKRFIKEMLPEKLKKKENRERKGDRSRKKQASAGLTQADAEQMLPDTF